MTSDDLWWPPMTSAGVIFENVGPGLHQHLHAGERREAGVVRLWQGVEGVERELFRERRAVAIGCRCEYTDCVRCLDAGASLILLSHVLCSLSQIGGSWTGVTLQYDDSLCTGRGGSQQGPLRGVAEVEKNFADCEVKRRDSQSRLLFDGEKWGGFRRNIRLNFLLSGCCEKDWQILSV